jgi:hypothetical protein
MKVLRCVQCGRDKERCLFPKLAGTGGYERRCINCKTKFPEWKPETLGQLDDVLDDQIYRLLHEAHLRPVESESGRYGFKVCQTCNKEKHKSAFPMCKAWKGTLSPICQACDDKLAEYKERVLSEREREALEELEAANWWVDNKDKVDEWIRAYSLEFVLEQLRQQGRQRAAAQLRATPRWADPKKIAAIYAEAYRLTKERGEPYHVDHIVPLQGPIAKYGPFRGERLVYGLHCEDNLRVLRGVENQSKGNRYWPDMPGENRCADEMLRQAA